MKKIKLFCLPYAGGSSSIYNRWNMCVNDFIEVYPLELAGRGKRYSDFLYDNMEEVVNDIYRLIEKEIHDNSRYSIFGHSLGGLIAYELAHKIIQEGNPQPEHIFFSGTKAPHFERYKDKIHTLSNAELIQRIVELGGTPKKLAEDKAFAEVFLPILRADFKVNEAYKYIEKQSKIGCDITVLYGKQENINNNEITEWERHTSGKCNVFSIDGDHFFVNTHAGDVISIINNLFSVK